jgi:imidazolonepropionase-like amidohydrolase
MSLLICDATVIDGVAEKPAEGQSIWIEEGRIKAIGRRDALRVPPSVQVLEARGKYALPGLMDANVHLMGDIRVEQLVRYEDHYDEVIAEAAQVALKSGLTTVFDTWGPRQPLMKVRDDINSGKIPGSRIFCAGNIIGLDGPFSADFLPKAPEAISGSLVQRINAAWVENVGPDLTWMTPEQVAREVRAYLDTGIDFVKYASSEHRAAEPNAFLVFSPLVQGRIVAEAHRAGTTAQAHTTSVEALRVAVEAGCDIIQHCNITGPVEIPQSTIDMLVTNETGVVVFPMTQRRLSIMKDTLSAALRRHWSTVDTNCRALIASRARLLLGTDAVLQASDVAGDTPDPANEDCLWELGPGHFRWLQAMEEKGFPAMEGLKAATRNIAIAYGKEKDVGTLQPGKIADVLILQENPLLAAKNYRSIQAVIKDGRVVDRDKLPANPVLTKRVPAPVADKLPYGRFAASRYPCC